MTYISPLTIACGLGLGAMAFGIIVIAIQEISKFIRYKRFEDEMMRKLARVCIMHSIDIEDTPRLLCDLLNEKKRS